MKGLLIKDLYTIAGYGKQYGIVFLFMAVWSAVTKSISFLTMYTILLGGMLILSTLSIDENAHFNRYALTMPVSRRTLLIEKYIALVLFIGVGSLFTCLIVGGAAAMHLSDGKEELVMILVMTTFFLLSYSITFPIIFKYGIEKSRYIYILVTMVMALVVIGGASALKLEMVSESVMRAGIPAFAAVLTLLGICTVIDAVAVFLSYRISLKIVKKREW